MSNTIIIHKAHLGREPELRTTSTGKKVLNLRIAEATRRDEDSEWYSVSVWGARADALSTLLKQGSKIGVVGRLKVRRYDHNGEKRFSFEIDANEIILLDSRQDSSQGQWSQQPAQAAQPAQPAQPSEPLWSTQSQWSQPTGQSYQSQWSEQRNQNEPPF